MTIDVKNTASIEANQNLIETDRIDNQEEVSDLTVKEISRRLLSRNKKAYEALAK